MIRHWSCFPFPAILVSGFLDAGCHAKAPAKPQQQSVFRDTVVVRFTDTATVSGSPADARTFELRTAGQRDALRTILRQERAQWRSIDARSYQYLLKVDCFCPGRRGWLMMEVRESQPLRAWDAAGKSAAITDWNTFSIEGLFDMLEQTVNTDGVVQVAFDRRWHFPAYIRTVRRPGPDTWSIIDARGFRPLPESKIAFASRRDGNWEIYTMDAAGRGQTRLTTRNEQERFPLWSPDRSKIAFGLQVGITDFDPWELWVMDADGTNARKLFSRIEAKGARQWSPDGTRIALSSVRDGNPEIYTVRADGSGLQRLTNSQGEDRDPSWSPDGTQIVFSSARDGNSEIYVMRADGTNQRRITQHDAKDTQPVWSPIDSRIAFVSSRDGNRELYLARPDGRGLQRLTNDPTDDHVPVWSPDGTRIAFQATRGDEYDIEVVRVGDRARTRLTLTAGYDGGQSWSPDGREIVFISSRNSPDALYIMSASDGRARRLSSSPSLNPAWWR